MPKTKIGSSAEQLDLFIRRAHELLEAGYRRMVPAEYNTLQEPEITGELALRIEAVLREKRKPWHRPWSVHEEAPENEEHLSVARRRKGKNRKRPDIKLRFSGQRENLYLRFEAKLLTNTGAYQDLIGLDPEKHALARFLQRRYGWSDFAGGLIGYVQVGTEQDHSDRVMAAFADIDRFHISPAGTWVKVNWKNGPEYCFQTEHHRQGTRETIAIFHTFLRFR